jgi:hypothetical protein
MIMSSTTSEEDAMGLMLVPQDSDGAGPDVSWSYTGFHMYRQWLARAEGFVFTEMHGFGGDRPWSEVSTTLEPLLRHRDDEGDIPPAQCAAMLPRLEAIIEERSAHGDDPDDPRRVADTRELVTVVRHCRDKDVPLVFC